MNQGKLGKIREKGALYVWAEHKNRRATDDTILIDIFNQGGRHICTSPLDEPELHIIKNSQLTSSSIYTLISLHSTFDIVIGR